MLEEGTKEMYWSDLTYPREIFLGKTICSSEFEGNGLGELAFKKRGHGKIRRCPWEERRPRQRLAKMTLPGSDPGKGRKKAVAIRRRGGGWGVPCGQTGPLKKEKEIKNDGRAQREKIAKGNIGEEGEKKVLEEKGSAQSLGRIAPEQD